MPEDIIEIELTPVELTYLSTILGADILIGIGDPFFGWLSGEIKEAQARAHASLCEREIVKEDENGNSIVDVIAAGVISKCANPIVTYMIYNKPYNEDGLITVFQIDGELSLIYTFPEDAEESVSFSFYKDYKKTAERMKKIIGIVESKNIVDVTIVTNIDILWRAIDAAGKREKMLSILKEADVESNAASILTKTLMSNFCISSLLEIRFNDGEWNLEGMAALRSDDYLWHIMPELNSDEVLISMSISNMANVKEAMESFIERSTGIGN